MWWKDPLLSSFEVKCASYLVNHPSPLLGIESVGFTLMKTAAAYKCFPLSVIVSVTLVPTFHQFVLAAYYNATHLILLNCGETSATKDSDGQIWSPDQANENFPASWISSASVLRHDIPHVPFTSARLSHQDFVYSFSLSPGSVFLRLYFAPVSYSGFEVSDAIFSVSIGSSILLNNFNVSQTAEALSSSFVVKEYWVMGVYDKLDVTFHPSSVFLNAYAFVSGIEVVSAPSTLSKPNRVFDIVSKGSMLSVANTAVLENVYRVNVGGGYISPSRDNGMLRTWSNESMFLQRDEVGVVESVHSTTDTWNRILASTLIAAPVDVYSTARSMRSIETINLDYNLTWTFSVDFGFYYLVRLHFCEINANIRKKNQRVFEIFLNDQTAEKEADVIAWAGGDGVPVFRDYVVDASAGFRSLAQEDLHLSLSPSSASQYNNAILNGIEIFKMINGGSQVSDGKSLPRISSVSSPFMKGKVIAVTIAICVITFALFIGCGVIIAVLRRGRLLKVISNEPTGLLLSPGRQSADLTEKRGDRYQHSSTSNNFCRRFSLAEIKAATNNLDEAMLLGVGGFGKVYIGEIDGGKTKVAVKHAKPLAAQGMNEFQNEIEMLSKLHHLHLISLLGYCNENSEMILVYEYMVNGTLSSHLYRSQNPPLSWKQRLEICIGVARGLHYLHTGAQHPIIHRDVKTVNILLDENLVAKLSDFGLSKAVSTRDQSHVSTNVKGTFGYLDPEYFRWKQLTEKSDVYSFGAVMMEILCGRPAVDSSMPIEQIGLASWVAECHKKGVLAEIIDPHLKGMIAPQCFKKYTETALNCLAHRRIDRPLMFEVCFNLEFAFKLQEGAQETSHGDFIINVECLSSLSSRRDKHPETYYSSSGASINDSRNNGTDAITDGRSMATQASYLDYDGAENSILYECEEDQCLRSKVFLERKISKLQKKIDSRSKRDCPGREDQKTKPDDSFHVVGFTTILRTRQEWQKPLTSTCIFLMTKRIIFLPYLRTMYHVKYR